MRDIRSAASESRVPSIGTAWHFTPASHTPSGDVKTSELAKLAEIWSRVSGIATSSNYVILQPGHRLPSSWCYSDHGASAFFSTDAKIGK